MFQSKVSYTIGLTTKEGGKLVPPGDVVEWFAKVCDSFTVVHAEWYWKGVPEKVLVISVLTSTAGKIVALEADLCAREFARTFDQECVLWEVQKLDAGLSYQQKLAYHVD